MRFKFENFSKQVKDCTKNCLKNMEEEYEPTDFSRKSSTFPKQPKSCQSSVIESQDHQNNYATESLVAFMDKSPHDSPAIMNKPSKKISRVQQDTKSPNGRNSDNEFLFNNVFDKNNPRRSTRSAQKKKIDKENISSSVIDLTEQTPKQQASDHNIRDLILEENIPDLILEDEMRPQQIIQNVSNNNNQDRPSPPSNS